MLAVCGFNLKILLACPFIPIMLIVPCSLSIWVIAVRCSSAGSTAVSVIILNRQVYFSDAEFIISLTFSVVGIIGIGGWYRILGLS